MSSPGMEQIRAGEVRECWHFKGSHGPIFCVSTVMGKIPSLADRMIFGPRCDVAIHIFIRSDRTITRIARRNLWVSCMETRGRSDDFQAMKLDFAHMALKATEVDLNLMRVHKGPIAFMRTFTFEAGNSGLILPLSDYATKHSLRIPRARTTDVGGSTCPVGLSDFRPLSRFVEDPTGLGLNG
ncbi:hypothetical protein DFH94DRAFT_153643 [Russula ochroleuca]|uniref:Uncharacterized protein n=1 Tax=Russula ochroleuca TaxID=152965 RepID=A0A9P5N3J0_9AGAM|nr:hypothetical protein DFH94DRAFT_153643 [Russula ochroleuca]